MSPTSENYLDPRINGTNIEKFCHYPLEPAQPRTWEVRSARKLIFMEVGIKQCFKGRQFINTSALGPSDGTAPRYMLRVDAYLVEFGSSCLTGDVLCVLGFTREITSKGMCMCTQSLSSGDDINPSTKSLQLMGCSLPSLWRTICFAQNLLI